jgi:hypothetical protein
MIRILSVIDASHAYELEEGSISSGGRTSSVTLGNNGEAMTGQATSASEAKRMTTVLVNCIVFCSQREVSTSGFIQEPAANPLNHSLDTASRTQKYSVECAWL